MASTLRASLFEEAAGSITTGFLHLLSLEDIGRFVGEESKWDGLCMASVGKD